LKHVKVSKEEILKNNFINNRRTLWKWGYLYKSGQSVFLNEEINASAIDKRIEAYHKTCPYSEEEMIRSMHSKMDDLIIPREHLEWMHNEKRHMLWIKKKLANKIPPVAQPNTVSDFQSVLYSIDMWDTPMLDKILTIEGLKFAWTEHKLRDVFFDWFRGKDEQKKIEATYDIAITQQRHLSHESHTLETITDVILFFDQLEISNAEFELLTKKIKSRWSQNKYRNNLVGKKQYNFYLSEQAIESLDRLSEKNNKKRAEILELLIKMEDKEGLYTDQSSKKQPETPEQFKI
tara:strand:+ start:2531 stop:3403 length:873 start_codon:yes stop_codon:yes gene_type:complete